MVAFVSDTTPSSSTDGLGAEGAGDGMIVEGRAMSWRCQAVCVNT
jgi:hypothetical protein